MADGPVRQRRPPLRVNLTAQARQALEYLKEQGLTANQAVSEGLITAARESWERNERNK